LTIGIGEVIMVEFGEVLVEEVGKLRFRRKIVDENYLD